MADTFHMVNVDVGTSDGTVLTAGGSETFVIIGCQVANMHATTACHLTTTVYQSGGSTNAIIWYPLHCRNCMWLCLYDWLSF